MIINIKERNFSEINYFLLIFLCYRKNSRLELFRDVDKYERFEMKNIDDMIPILMHEYLKASGQMIVKSVNITTFNNTNLT